MDNTIPNCEICKEYQCHYSGRLSLNGQMTPDWHYLCRDCIVTGLEEIINAFKVKLKYYSLPILFIQCVEDNELVPCTRKGDMFDV